MMALGLNLFICGVYDFSLFYKVFINIHEYANNTIYISDYVSNDVSKL